jgi:hypothetical protein
VRYRASRRAAGSTKNSLSNGQLPVCLFDCPLKKKKKKKKYNWRKSLRLLSKFLHFSIGNEVRE